MKAHAVLAQVTFAAVLALALPQSAVAYSYYTNRVQSQSSHHSILNPQLDARYSRSRPNLSEVFKRSQVAIRYYDRLLAGDSKVFDGFEDAYRKYRNQLERTPWLMNDPSQMVDYKTFVTYKIMDVYQRSVDEFVTNFRSPRLEEMSWKITTAEGLLAHVRALRERLGTKSVLTAEDFVEITATKELAQQFFQLSIMSEDIADSIVLEMRKISSQYHSLLGVEKIELMPALFQHTQEVKALPSSGESETRRRQRQRREQESAPLIERRQASASDLLV
jgi:hypothetical protein